MTKLEIYTLAVENFDIIPKSTSEEVTEFTRTLDLDCSNYSNCSSACPLYKHGCMSGVLSLHYPFEDEELPALELLRKENK